MTIEPIARFHSPFGEKFGIPRQSGLVEELKGKIVFEPGFRRPEALKGLEGFSHLWIIWAFDRNGTGGPWKATVRPPRLGGNENVGVFASRSPFRPNPLGLSAVKIAGIDKENCSIEVLGADLADGTAIYDIKPYVKYCDSIPDAACGFVDGKAWTGLEVVFPAPLREKFSPEDAAALEKVLSMDPRPRYQDDPAKQYGMLYSGMNVRFMVDGGVLTVISVEK